MRFKILLEPKGPCVFVVGDEFLNFLFRRRISDDRLRLRNPFRHPRNRGNHFRLRNDSTEGMHTTAAAATGIATPEGL